MWSQVKFPPRSASFRLLCCTSGIKCPILDLICKVPSGWSSNAGPFIPLLARLLAGINKVCGSWRCIYSRLIKWLCSSSTQGFKLLPHTEANGLSADVSQKHRNIPLTSFSPHKLLIRASHMHFCFSSSDLTAALTVSFSVIHIK